MDTNNENIIKTLKSVSLFKDFANDEQALQKVAGILKLASFDEGKCILNEGEVGDKLYILKEGQVSVLKKTLEKETYTIVNISASETSLPFFGELALIDNDKRSATIKAINKCSGFSINREDFIKFGNENPKLGLLITREISKKLSARLRQQNTEIILLFEALVKEIDEKT